MRICCVRLPRRWLNFWFFSLCLVVVFVFAVYLLTTSNSRSPQNYGRTKLWKTIFEYQTNTTPTPRRLPDETPQIKTLKSSLDAPKRAKVVEMIKHAWHGYEKYAWGFNQVRPVSKNVDGMENFFGRNFGVTIVDSLDTLFLANLTEEFEKAKAWVNSSFSFSGRHSIGLFETNIRFVGGLLSAYALTKDQLFLTQAKDVAHKLLPAFNTRTGFPVGSVSLDTASAAQGGCVILAEIGTVSMEFLYLSHVTGDPIYREKIEKMIKRLAAVPKPHGLYFTSIDAESGTWCNRHSSVGSAGDSFYEYLFKSWLLTSRHEKSMKVAFDMAMEAVFDNLLQTSIGGYKYFGEMRDSMVLPRMEHLACFMGGLLAMSAKTSSNETAYMEVADAIGETCHLSYNSTPTGLGPDSFMFGTNEEASARSNPQGARYFQRPETVETYFYLWRLTHNPKWRQYGWEMVEAIEKHTKTDAGYSGVLDVYQVPAQLDDVQQSFFLAETLKYLYLLFSPDDVLPLDKYVFNTEAHPLPIFKP